MNYEHVHLAQGGWQKLSFPEQMANIGSEVLRALNWRQKNNPQYSQQAFFRSLELLSLTINNQIKHPARLKELTRLKELLVDYFFGQNQYKSTPQLWQNYFMAFNFLARQGKYKS